ncbi:PI-PLC X domain-containing protein 2-like [Cotesia glomerata]|uniref:PI-PLC X domain-containing protein 2-like n=1 Tax=Cotesia glomerata TaxID=32391 RepID=UPI001D02483C|nr:PI-PLC X domain-containing protein 2-like [Cotesia glomerata]
MFKLNNIISAVIFIKIFGNSSANECNTSQIILSYAPINDSQEIRGQIVIYWFLEDFKLGDSLVLYHDTKDLFFTYFPKNSSGFVKTGIAPVDARYSLESMYIDQCTGYHVAWLRNSTELMLTCLSSHANWMYDNRKIIENLTLAELFIPGTHNSGSYRYELPPTILDRYTVTQEKSVMDQLLTGIRYLDIRPCIVDNKYWVCHGLFAMQPLDDIFKDIKDFLDNTMEIVIINFKEFPQGFEILESHLNFLNYLLDEFEGYFLETFQIHQKTLGEIWKSDNRLIFSYVSEFEALPNLNQSKLIYQSLMVAQNLFICSREFSKMNLRAVMAEITLDSSMIIVDAALFYFGRGEKSLRELAVQTGPLVTMWYKKRHFKTANIVAVDFIDATGIIEVAIWSNIYRAKCDMSN